MRRTYGGSLVELGLEGVDVERHCPGGPLTAGARQFVARYSHGERSVEELARYVAASALCPTGTGGNNRQRVAFGAQSDGTDAKGNIAAA